MSVVIGFSFPEEAILISDSRISYMRGELVIGSKDNLQKIFPLTPSLAVGFTSADVDVTHKILKKMEEYIKTKAKIKYTYPLIEDLQRNASYEYSQLTKSGKKPAMEFVFTGILNDRGLLLSEPYVMSLFFKEGGGGRVPEPIGKALMTLNNGYMSVPAPTPIVFKQVFPSGQSTPIKFWDLVSSGSGQSIGKLFSKEYSKLLGTSSDGDFRSNIIRMYCDDFIKQSGIPSIGGGVQVLRMNSTGIQPVTLSLNSIDSKGNTKKIQSMDFDGKDWIYKNTETGKQAIISPFKLSINKQLATFL